MAVQAEVLQGKAEAGSEGSLHDSAAGGTRVGADELGAAGDHHLRGVDVVEVELRAVLALAAGEEGRGESVAPAEVVPVVDVLLKDDDLGGGDGLVVVEPGEEGVGGRAARTTLGGEELDEDGGAGRGRLGARGDGHQG